MIRFTCAGCGRSFTVPDEFAGRRATCKACGSPIVVPEKSAPLATAALAPAPVAAVPYDSSTGLSAPIAHVPQVAPVAPVQAPPSPSHASAAPSKIPLRIRRLTSDATQMVEAFTDFPLIQLRGSTGNPPDVYEVEYRVHGLEHGPADEPVARDIHRVEIRLTADYPRSAPVCRMLTPIFHPNIDPASICIGDHWTAGERLASLVVRIGEMIAYQAYNIQSPLDAEAAMWADLNRQRLPIDPRNLHPIEGA